MSQLDLARRAGMSASAVCRLETGQNRNTLKILELAEALSVTAEWLKTGQAAAPQSAISTDDCGCRNCMGGNLAGLVERLHLLPSDAIHEIRKLADSYASAAEDAAG